jgi:hypothetical protein
MSGIAAKIIHCARSLVSLLYLSLRMRRKSWVLASGVFNARPNLSSGRPSARFWQNDKPQGLPLRESSWRRMFCRDLFTGFIRTKAASEKRVPIVVNNQTCSRSNPCHFVADLPSLKTVQPLDTFVDPISSHWTICQHHH